MRMLGARVRIQYLRAAYNIIHSDMCARMCTCTIICTFRLVAPFSSPDRMAFRAACCLSRRCACRVCVCVFVSTRKAIHHEHEIIRCVHACNAHNHANMHTHTHTRRLGWAQAEVYMNNAMRLMKMLDLLHHISAKANALNRSACARFMHTMSSSSSTSLVVVVDIVCCAPGVCQYVWMCLCAMCVLCFHALG